MNQNDFEIQASGLGYIGPWTYDDGLVVWGGGNVSMGSFLYLASLGATMQNYDADTINEGIGCMDTMICCDTCDCCPSGLSALKSEIEE